jgi:choline-sulfatase
MATQRNVVWIMADQHAGFASGCYGHPVVQTPNIDRLAREGMRFENAYTPSPVCVPARFAAMTGRYPHTTGCTGNDTPLPVWERTAAHAFAGAHALTAFIGKMHPVDPQTHGFDFLVDLGHYYDYLGPKVEIWGRGMDARNTGCGLPWMDSWYTPHTWLDRPLNPELPSVLAEPDHFEAFVAHNCQVFLREYGQHPFFLFASLIKPHFPYVSPPEYHALYDAAEMVLPGTAHDWHEVPEARRTHLVRNLDDPEARQAALAEIADYFAATTYMDACVGRILAAIDDLGLRDETLVIYTSDHGEMLFHHGLRQKFVFYEQSARVPLIARLPGVIEPGSTTHALADLTDLLPTSLSLAGVESRFPMDGVDLSPVLQGEASSVRDACFSELGESMMVRSGRWKLAFYPSDQWHLFDLASDGDERDNLYGRHKDNPEIAALHDDLLRWRQDTRSR